MARCPAEDDTVTGTATDIARLLPDAEGRPMPINTLIWLHRRGVLPVARLGPLWVTQLSSLTEARERARARGEVWAQLDKRPRRARQPKQEAEYA